MESLISEPGPKNPLLFLALSLVNRIPGYNPDEKETLNQIECMNDLISSVSASIFRLESVKNAVAVAVDALMTISVAEAKKSIAVRVSALECLNFLIEKVTASGINSIISILPGILSRMIKISTGRVDVEVTSIIQLSLKIIKKMIQCFWVEQNDWLSEEYPEKFIVLRQKYRENIDLAVCSLRPLIKSQRLSEFHEDLLDIFEFHLNGYTEPSNSCLKLYLLLNNTDSRPLVHQKKFIQLYNTEIVEWFDINSDSLKSIHEDVLLERLQLILGMTALKNSESFLMISDLFMIVKKLSEVNVSIGSDTVSIEYSDSSNYGIQNSLNSSDIKDENIVPTINFKQSLKFSKDFYIVLFCIFEKMIQFDPEAVQKLLLQLEDNSIEEIIQKIDMTSFYYRSGCLKDFSLLKDCLKYHERSLNHVDEVRLIHLATLKLLWSCQQFSKDSEGFNKVIRPNLLTILSGMTSGWIILREVSTQILKEIAKGLGLSVIDFIKQNDQFLLDRLGIQFSLPSLYPTAPQIISCLVRDIVDPSTALKFTDLLVKKVSDNLAIYQRHSAYCKDLISVAKETVEIVSKSVPIKLVDPKDFAFTKKDTEQEDSDVRNELSCQQRIICDLLKISLNFILSDSKSIRSKSIELIQVSVNNFIRESKSEPTELCQLIHLAWPYMISVLKESINRDSVQLDVLVVESFANCCKVLFEKMPLFMRDRFVKDYWRSVLKSYKSPSLMVSSSMIKICHLLSDTLNYGLIYCKPSTEICLEVLDYIKILQNQGPIEGLFKTLQNLEPDIIWYYSSIELGQLTEIKSFYPELKSFKLK